eukprot:7363740-Lingulodinium_polyedra.AAC.1
MSGSAVVEADGSDRLVDTQQASAADGVDADAAPDRGSGFASADNPPAAIGQHITMDAELEEELEKIMDEYER